MYTPDHTVMKDDWRTNNYGKWFDLPCGGTLCMCEADTRHEEDRKCGEVSERKENGVIVDS